MLPSRQRFTPALRSAVRMINPLNSDLREETAQLAAEHRLPIIYAFRKDVVAGRLISYGTSLPGKYRQAALLRKIFHGTKLADLPVEQPTRFNLAINLKTATALDISVPPALLDRADEVIE
jgi:putative ABC transport system substrate-binding protein